MSNPGKAMYAEEPFAYLANTKFKFDSHLHIEVQDVINVASEPRELYQSAVPATVHPGALEVAALIHSFCQAENVYLFAQRTEEESATDFLNINASRRNKVHFYLLVVARNTRTNMIADTSDFIRTHAGFAIEVTILLHKPADLVYAHRKYLHFFQTLLHNGIRLFSSENAEALKIPGSFTRDWNAARKYWKRRKIIAATFLEASGSDTSDDGQAGIAMLQIGIEHLFLGLIEVYLGYRPRHFALGYLLDLCCYFAEWLSDKLPRNTEEDKKVFKVLSTGLSSLRLAAAKKPNLELSELLHLRCGILYDSVVARAETHLEKMDAANGTPDK